MDTRNGVWTSSAFDRERVSNNNPDVVSVHASIASSIVRSGSKPTHFNSNLVGVQSRFRRKYYHKVVLAILIFFIIILIIAVIILAIGKSTQSRQTCNSKECLRIGASLIYTMDTTVDPCENFYEFTCGNWATDHPKPDSVTSNDWFREAQSKTLRYVREFLGSEINDTEPNAVSKTKTMYSACMDVALMEDLNLYPLMHYLSLFELPDIPSSLNLSLPADEKINDPPFNWVASLVHIKKHMGMDLIIGFDIFPDPVNRSVNRIAVGTPETESPLPFNDDYHKRLLKAKKKLISSLSDDDSSEEDNSTSDSVGLSAYVLYIRKVVVIIVEYLYPEMNSDEIDAAARELTYDAINITKQIYKMREEAENSTKASVNPLDDIVYLSLSELQNQTDKLIYPKTLPIWETYLQLIMDTNKGFKVSEEVLITSRTDIVYLQYLAEYLLDLPSSRLQFYIWLNIVEELILHTTSAIRQLHSEYMKIIIQTEGNTPRSLYCANGINNLMGMAVSFSLADDEFTLNTLPKVHDMLFYIRESFNDLVKSTSWMDSKTKQATLQKSAAMKSLIGFPEWITNKTLLDEFYADVTVSNKTHLDNMMNVLKWQMSNKIRNFKEVNDLGWATSPSNVNAFHTFQSNTITIPIAILQYPFYSLGLEALNYGAIGTILGHELTHGFDDSGRMYDRSGNMRQWWSNDTILEYVNRTECFIEQYGRYILPDIGEYVDGELTLGENIADNGGLREAFYAYKKYVKKFGVENKLPGLEHYSHEQLFFISFGNLWCETLTPAASRYALQDSHCPGSIRLKGVLSNSEEFARTFKCKRGSRMFPDNTKCRIW